MQQWRARNVSVQLSRTLLLRAEGKYPGKREGNCKDMRQAFVSTASEVTGVDLWIDGICVRGRIADAVHRGAAQTKLEEHVSNGGWWR